MIELLFTITGILAGVAIVASLLHYHIELLNFGANGKADIPESISGIADQLQIITNRVSASISQHSERIGLATSSLNQPKSEKSGGLASAVDEILKANLAMQAQLAEAKDQIANQSSLIETATQEARTDALTGLANRRALDEYLRKCVESVTKGQFVGFLLMDIDHFKKFNDTHGHTTGDAVLSNFARSIATCCGSESFPARYGGEEFAVIVTGDSTDDLLGKAATIRRFASSQLLNYEGLELKVTASGGLCRLLPGDSTSGAYERSDQGLYEAKKAGRNCGLSLDESGWIPFPEVPIETLSERASRLQAAPRPDVSKTNETVPTPAVKTKTITQDTTPVADSKPKSSDTRIGKILDLNSFLTPLESHMEQLRAVDLPATAMMVEAIGLNDPANQAAGESWAEAANLIQQSLRGIDVVCLYRQHTLCIFLPGCSQNAAVERAAHIQAKLRTSKCDWPVENCPERLAIAVATASQYEDGAQFLDRLEAALDEAIDATESQVVIHSGESCHFQEV